MTTKRASLPSAVALSLSVVLAGSQASARWWDHDASRMHFELPDDFQVRQEGPLLIAAPPGAVPGIAYLFTAITGGAPEGAAAERRVLQVLTTVLPDARITSRYPTRPQNGLRCFAFSGVGTNRGRPGEFIQQTCSDGHGHALVAMVMLQPGQLGARANEFNRVFGSVSPIGR